jgi:signal transduction histidine kinase
MSNKIAVLTVWLLFLVFFEVLIAFGYVAKQNDMSEQRTSIYNSFIELQNQIGYAGLIHNFKNFILRPENKEYQDKAINNYLNAMVELDKIETIGTNIIGKLEMQHTREMLTAYKSRLELLPSLLSKKLSARELDSYVNYNDEASHSEIKSTTALVTIELESQILDFRSRSLKSSFIILIALLITVIFIIRFFFKEQRQALQRSNAANNEMQKQETKMIRSQEILVGVMQDVEREKAQTARVNKRLLSKNQEMEQFIYTVSHDLKSPLVTINAFTQRLFVELGETLTEKQTYRFNRIIENINNMETLLVDLLDLSRIVQKAVTNSMINVKTTVSEQIDALESNISQSNATIRFVGNLHMINANPRLFSEAVLNVLSNAIKYREPTRKLFIDIFTTQAPTSTTIHIKDNGIGLDPKYHELIFEIFERLSSGEGSGVGLTIVKTIMQKHKGQVTLESKLDQGCCFSLTFPNNQEIEDKEGEEGI